MKKTLCSFCNKPIFWVKMRETGLNVPMNAKVNGSPKKTVGYQVNFDTMTGFKVDVFSPHFGKCTAAGRKGLDVIYKDVDFDPREGD